MIDKKRIAVCALTFLLPTATIADTVDPEIQYLLESIGQSECAFIRNGKAHDAAEAESHLRMKYGRARSRINSSEKFIERIASESSRSGKPYLIECPDAESRRSRDWLLERLNAYRREK